MPGSRVLTSGLFCGLGHTGFGFRPKGYRVQAVGRALTYCEDAVMTLSRKHRLLFCIWSPEVTMDLTQPILALCSPSETCVRQSLYVEGFRVEQLLALKLVSLRCNTQHSDGRQTSDIRQTLNPKALSETLKNIQSPTFQSLKQQVQNITKMPLFICLPFGLPKAPRAAGGGATTVVH